MASQRFEKLHLVGLEVRDVPSVVFVDDNKQQFPQAKYTTIQAAVNAAAPGDTIRVAAGTYREQVTVPNNRDGLKIVAASPWAAPVVKVPTVMTGSKALVHVDGADNVKIEGLVLTGPGDVDYGILIDHGGSATVRDNTVSTIRSSPLSGLQTGFGICVGGPSDLGSTPGRATVEGNLVRDYQKGGILVLSPGTDADIRYNVVTGAGPTAVIAQNGIQVSDGADAELVGNLVSKNSYTPPDFAATGILVYGAGDVRLKNNSVWGNDVGIYLFDLDRARVEGNNAFANLFEGIYVDTVTNSQFTGNRAVGNGYTGFTITGESSGNTFRWNLAFCNAGPYDVLDETTGSGTGGTANRYQFNGFGSDNF